MSRLYLFDLDGTLVHDYLRDKPEGGYEPDPEHPYVEPHLLPGRNERLAELAAERAFFGICTNQAGAALGYCPKAHTHERVAKSLVLIDHFHGRPFTVQICFHHPQAKVEPWSEERTDENLSRRKPKGGMLLDAMEMFEGAINPADVVYVGDRETDLQAALDAGVIFVWAEEFFGAG